MGKSIEKILGDIVSLQSSFEERLEGIRLTGLGMLDVITEHGESNHESFTKVEEYLSDFSQRISDLEEKLKRMDS